MPTLEIDDATWARLTLIAARNGYTIGEAASECVSLAHEAFQQFTQGAEPRLEFHHPNHTVTMKLNLEQERWKQRQDQKR